jgi:7-cyano-7-deazaguanine reductase
MLETFQNPHPDRDYLICHNTEEFTSLCPKTGQPDFAFIKVQYVADEKCVESKSLKLYLFAFRNEGAFMENIVNTILNDLVEATEPRSMLVVGVFAARGGLKTTVEAEYVKPKPEPRNCSVQ